MSRRLIICLMSMCLSLTGAADGLHTNDFADAILTWVENRANPITVADADGTWLVARTTGEPLTTEYTPVSGIIGLHGDESTSIAPNGKRFYPIVCVCPDGGVRPDANHLYLEKEEIYLHPGCVDSDELLITFTAAVAGRYCLSGCVRALHNTVLDGVRVIITGAQQLGTPIEATKKGMVFGIASDWFYLDAGASVSLQFARNESYSNDGTGLRLRIIRDLDESSDWKKLPSTVMPEKEFRNKQIVKAVLSTNKLSDAIHDWIQSRTFPVSARANDGEWTVRLSSGDAFSNYYEVAADMKGCSAAANALPWVLLCENGGVSAESGKSQLGAGEVFFHPGNTDATQVEVVFVAASSGLYRLKGAIRSTNNVWGSSGDGVSVTASAAGVAVLNSVVTTVDGASHAIESEWFQLDAGQSVVVKFDRRSVYSCDGSGIYLNVEHAQGASRRFVQSSLTEAINNYAAAGSECYQNCILAGGFSFDLGYRNGIGQDHLSFQETYQQGSAFIGWKHIDVIPLVAFNVSGESTKASDDLVSTNPDEWRVHPGAGVYNSFRITALRNFGAGEELVFKFRDLNPNSNSPSPGEEFFISTNGVAAAHALLDKCGSDVSVVLPISGLRRGDTVELVQRSRYKDGADVNCDMTALSIAHRKPRQGMMVILR